jgi:hypothetical protein
MLVEDSILRTRLRSLITFSECMSTSPTQIAGLISGNMPITHMARDQLLNVIVTGLLGTIIGKVTALVVLLTCITTFTDGVRAFVLLRIYDWRGFANASELEQV